MKMSDLIHRAQKAKTLAVDLSLAKWQRLGQGLQAFSGLELSAMAGDVRQEFEADFVDINRVLAQYPLNEDDDFQIISDADLGKMLDTLDMPAARVIAASWIGLSPTSMTPGTGCQRRRLKRPANIAT